MSTILTQRYALTPDQALEILARGGGVMGWIGAVSVQLSRDEAKRALETIRDSEGCGRFTEVFSYESPEVTNYVWMAERR